MSVKFKYWYSVWMGERVVVLFNVSDLADNLMFCASEIIVFVETISRPVITDGGRTGTVVVSGKCVQNVSSLYVLFVWTPNRSRTPERCRYNGATETVKPVKSFAAIKPFSHRRPFWSSVKPKRRIMILIISSHDSYVHAYALVITVTNPEIIQRRQYYILFNTKFRLIQWKSALKYLLIYSSWGVFTPLYPLPRWARNRKIQFVFYHT